MMALWTTRIEGGPKRVNHAAVCVSSVVYSFGGYCTGDNFAVRKDIDVHAFDLTTYKWSKVVYKAEGTDAVPYQRYGHTAVAYNGLCYIYGGRNDVDGASEHLYMFNPATRCWHRPVVSGAIPFSRDGHSCCVIRNRMYLFAGFEEQSMEFCNTIYALDLDTYVWTWCRTTGTEPIERDFHSATRWNDYMVIFGGRSDEHGPIHTDREVYNNDVYMFNTTDHHWTRVDVSSPTPVGRRSHNAFEHDGKIYVFGGYNGLLSLHFNDLNVFDPVSRSWSQLVPAGVPPTLRRRSCCCKDGSRVVIFGGTSPVMVKETEKLDDLSDLFILDLAPSLKTLSFRAVLQMNADLDCLPWELQVEIQNLRRQSVIGRGPNG